MNRATDDLISRTAACASIGKMIKEYREKGEDDLADGMILARRYGINRLPTVDAVPVAHGLWIYFNSAGNEFYQCSECFHWVDAKTDRNYCPNCGAKMENNK